MLNVMNGKYIARNTRRRNRHRAGFTMVELLAVIGIMMILMSVAGTAVSTPRSRAGVAVEKLASSIGLASSFASSSNRLVWLEILPQEREPGSLEIRFHHSIDGSNRPEAVQRFRRSVILEGVALVEGLPDFGSRPQVDSGDRFREGDVVLIRPSGEIQVMRGGEGGFPLPEGGLRPLAEIGLQAVHGRSGRMVKDDMAAVQLRGRSGTPLIYQP